MKLPASYAGLTKSLSRYWRDYGGWSDFWRSPLLHLSLLITGASYAVWLRSSWVDLPLALLPNLLGFSLGAYALIFSLADQSLLAVLNKPTKDGTPTKLRMVNATFLHFILVQTLAIIFALTNKSTLLVDIARRLICVPYTSELVTNLLAWSAGFLGYLMTVYAIVLLIGAALAAYRLAVMSGRAASLAQQVRGAADPSAASDRSSETS